MAAWPRRYLLRGVWVHHQGPCGVARSLRKCLHSALHIFIAWVLLHAVRYLLAFYLSHLDCNLSGSMQHNNPNPDIGCARALLYHNRPRRPNFGHEDICLLLTEYMWGVAPSFRPVYARSDPVWVPGDTIRWRRRAGEAADCTRKQATHTALVNTHVIRQVQCCSFLRQDVTSAVLSCNHTLFAWRQCSLDPKLIDGAERSFTPALVHGCALPFCLSKLEQGLAVLI